MLGAFFALLSAATFALNNAAARRGVVTGTPLQGMSISIPMGVVCFLPVALVLGELGRLADFPVAAAGWMAGVGLLHFVFGRYCNYSSAQAAGANLTAPVIQLQVIVTLVLAVVILREPCSALQMIGGALIFLGSIITQKRPGRRRAATVAAPAASDPDAPRPFVPRRAAGYVFASLTALAYGISPIMARFALEHTGPTSGILGGLIAYSAATVVVAAALLWRPIRRDVAALERESARWFIYSGIFVAVAQGLFFSALAIAPVLVVLPLLQTSLVFRFLFSAWLNPHHEIFGFFVILGIAISLAGALMVSVDTDLILNAFAVPEPLAQALRWRV